MRPKHLFLPSTYEAIRIADDALRLLLLSTDLPEVQVAGCELALHELLVNLIDHAYAGDPTQSIEITINLEGGTLQIKTVDTGVPAHVHLESITMPDSENLAESGYGMAIIQALVDKVEYQNEAGHNIWMLTKKL